MLGASGQLLGSGQQHPHRCIQLVAWCSYGARKPFQDQRGICKPSGTSFASSGYAAIEELVAHTK
jgi:hypothetical protein